jgi:uncharacterized phage-associated protein
MRNQIMEFVKDEQIFIEPSREKLIHAIIFFLENTKFCLKTKLFKLLYLLDFCHFKQTARSVTGLDYFAWEKGPVPKDLFEEFANPKKDLLQCIYIPKAKDPDGIFRMKPRCKFDPFFFTRRELRLMEQIAYIFRDAKADNMIEVTHLPNMPWDKTIKTKGEYNKIDYFLALDNTQESLSIDEAMGRINEMREIENLFKE